MSQPRTLIALHGFTGAPDSFLPLELPQKSYRVLAPHLTGHGPQPDFSSQCFEDELDRLAAVVSSLPAPRHLLGYSMGARVGLGLCVRYPRVFASATLIGVNFGLRSEEPRSMRRTWEENWIAMLHEDGLPEFERQWCRLPLFSSQEALSPEVRARQRRIRLHHTAKGLAHALDVLGLAKMPDYWPHLSHVSIPICLITGQKDEKFRLLAEEALQCLRTGEHVCVDGAGHDMLIEAPQHVVASLDACIARAAMTTSHWKGRAECP